jgi:hypothetical protein
MLSHLESKGVLFYLEDGGRRFFRNVGNIPPDYTASHP